MKSRIKTLITTSSLLLALSCIVINIYASNKYSNSIDLNIAKNKIQTKTKNTKKSKLASLEFPQTIEEDQILEDWMFDPDFYFLQKEYQIEKWMLTKEFWLLKKQSILNKKLKENSTKKNSPTLNYEPNKSSSGIYSNFLEKEWLKNNKAFIL